MSESTTIRRIGASLPAAGELTSGAETKLVETKLAEKNGQHVDTGRWWKRRAIAAPNAGALQEARMPSLACARVLDELLVMPDGTPARTVVVAQAAPLTAAVSVTSALTAEAVRRGLRALGAVLHVESGGLQIEPAADGATSQAAGAFRPRRLRLEGELRSNADDVLGWLAEVAASHDLVLIEAPALTQTSVGALLASVCDGLLILARAGVTAKHDLRNAAAIARSARCHTFGVFVDEPAGQLPSWLAGL
jgi:hypothetical protein